MAKKTTRLSEPELRVKLCDELMARRGFTQEAAFKFQQSLTLAQVRGNLADLKSEPALKSGPAQPEPVTASPSQLVAYNFQIQTGDLQQLRELSDEQAVSVSHLIRQAVKAFLKGAE